MFSPRAWQTSCIRCRCICFGRTPCKHPSFTFGRPHWSAACVLARRRTGQAFEENPHIVRTFHLLVRPPHSCTSVPRVPPPPLHRDCAHIHDWTMHICAATAPMLRSFLAPHFCMLIQSHRADSRVARQARGLSFQSLLTHPVIEFIPHAFQQKSTLQAHSLVLGRCRSILGRFGSDALAVTSHA